MTDIRIDLRAVAEDDCDLKEDERHLFFTLVDSPVEMEPLNADENYIIPDIAVEAVAPRVGTQVGLT
jgi:hypothetical protein